MYMQLLFKMVHQKVLFKIVHAITRWYTNATDAEKPCQNYRSKQKPDPVSAIMLKELPRLSVWHMQLELLHLQKLSNYQEETGGNMKITACHTE